MAGWQDGARGVFPRCSMIISVMLRALGELRALARGPHGADLKARRRGA
jgi:hypothetical protein